MSKKLYYIVEDNGDLSHTVTSIDECAEVIKGWIADNQKEMQDEHEMPWFQIECRWLTDEEYQKLLDEA